MLDTIIFILIAIILGGVILGFIIKKPHHTMAVYYAGMFFRRLVLPDVQVRVSVIIQIALMIFCFCCAVIGFSVNNRKAFKEIKGSTFWGFAIIISIVTAVEVVCGYFSGFSIFSILVDVYKVLEILMFFLLFNQIWRSTEEMDKALTLLCVEMCLFGIVEMFTTERGGVGINMVMCFFPIFFAKGIYGKVKMFWPIVICSALIVIVSKTRTYLIGLLLGLLLLMIFAKGKNRTSIWFVTIALVVVASFGVSAYVKNNESELISTIFARFTALLDGFDSAGGYRWEEMKVAWSKFLEKPFFGQGYGYQEYVYINKMGYTLWGDFMHNTYVEVLAKTGVFGAMFYGCGVLGFLLTLRKMIREHRKENNIKTVGHLAGGLAGTISWLFVYFAAPLSSYGYVFIPGIVGFLYATLSKQERKECPQILNGEQFGDGR